MDNFKQNKNVYNQLKKTEIRPFTTEETGKADKASLTKKGGSKAYIILSASISQNMKIKRSTKILNR